MQKSFHFEMNGTIQQNKTLYLMVYIHYQWKEEQAISLMHICSSGCWFHTNERKKIRTKILHSSMIPFAAIKMGV